MAQQDFHFGVTYYLAHKLGYSSEQCRKIAWANWHTDCQTEADIYGLQTQVKLLGGNWNDSQVQATVIVVFHFLSSRGAVVANSELVQKVIQSAIESKNLFRLGIVLHVCQDSFFHQGFSGWNEPLNACWPKLSFKRSLLSNIKSLFGRPLPNIGHAEMGTIPDEIDKVWIDPRSGAKIDNRERAMEAAKATFKVLQSWQWRYGTFGNCCAMSAYRDIKVRLNSIIYTKDYNERKLRLRRLDGNPPPPPRYSEITKKMERRYGDDFTDAARQHLAVVLENL